MNISRNDNPEMGSYYLRNEEHQQGCNLLQAKGGGGNYFFAYTPDMQYFKGRLPPTFSVPLMNYKKIRVEQVVPAIEILGEEFVIAPSKKASFFYVITPDIQYFKEGLPPSFRIPLMNMIQLPFLKYLHQKISDCTIIIFQQEYCKNYLSYNNIFGCI